jgi:hypothetical protein
MDTIFFTKILACENKHWNSVNHMHVNTVDFMERVPLGTILFSCVYLFIPLHDGANYLHVHQSLVLVVIPFLGHTFPHCLSLTHFFPINCCRDRHCESHSIQSQRAQGDRYTNNTATRSFPFLSSSFLVHTTCVATYSLDDRSQGAMRVHSDHLDRLDERGGIRRGA